MPGPRLLHPQGSGRFVLLCDHASNVIPASLGTLGLPPSDLARHIAWDIGAAGITQSVSAMLDSPAILSSVSRLVVDCNRHPDAGDLIPETSDGTPVPGNRNLDLPARADRLARWFHPYHDAIEEIVDRRRTGASQPVVISIHSMTNVLAGQGRPWQMAISSHLDRRLADPVLAALRRPGGIMVGDNQPYDLDPAVDYSIPFHAMRRGLPHLQVEFRQDLLATPVARTHWAMRLAQALAETA